MNDSLRKMARFALTLISLSLLILLSTGCTATRTRLTLEGTSSLSPPERARFLSLMRQRKEEIHTLRLLFKSTFRKSSVPESRTVRTALVFRNPDSVRLEILPFGAAQSLQLLVSSIDGSTLLSPSDRTAVVSRAEKGGLLRTALHLPLSEADLSFYMVARVPERFFALLSDERDAGISCNAITRRCLVELLQFGDQWIVDADSGRLLQAQLLNRFTKDPSVALQYSNQATAIDSVEIPQEINIAVPEQELQLEFRLIKGRINVSVPDALFEVFIPPSYSVVRP